MKRSIVYIIVILSVMIVGCASDDSPLGPNVSNLSRVSAAGPIDSGGERHFFLDNGSIYMTWEDGAFTEPVPTSSISGLPFKAVGAIGYLTRSIVAVNTAGTMMSEFTNGKWTAATPVADIVDLPFDDIGAIGTFGTQRRVYDGNGTRYVEITDGVIRTTVHGADREAHGTVAAMTDFRGRTIWFEKGTDKFTGEIAGMGPTTGGSALTLADMNPVIEISSFRFQCIYSCDGSDPGEFASKIRVEADGDGGFTIRELHWQSSLSDGEQEYIGDRFVWRSEIVNGGTATVVFACAEKDGAGVDSRLPGWQTTRDHVFDASLESSSSWHLTLGGTGCGVALWYQVRRL